MGYNEHMLTMGKHGKMGKPRSTILAKSMAMENK